MYYDEDGEEGMIPRFNLILRELVFLGQKTGNVKQEHQSAQEPQPAQFTFFKVAKEDLNGDGTEEEIKISDIDQEGNFVLKAGQASVKGKLKQGGADGFVIVDIDKSDKHKEVAVHTPGPSSDDEFLVYGFDGTVLKEMGRLSRWPKFTGNGIVYVDDWMGFWSKTSKYVLTNQRILKYVPQEFYSVNQEGTVRESFALQKSRTDNSVVAKLQKGSRITIVLCAPPSKNYYDDWFLIKSETNLLGWAKGRDMFERVDGLSFAD
ncbi:MAG: hypothetical protein M0021_00190 [Clostridia bacterium]|nr:hypothetical protein [Clostridia bacterium]